MKPSPTPWLVIHHKGHTIIVEKETMKHVCTLEAWENKEVTAELIVQAVNNHNDLLALLREISAWLENPDCSPETIQQIKAKVDEEIAKAGGSNTI